ncbi:MAG: WecB/TagA/CpsF family glycosyltransferase [Patescibacteria group bacterium]|nr:WecB/TagA/CpsF family glycosyltransferase [Patescibacteria group bacterium]MDD5490471.1 WecB/TagA/CpsF family glycosyltransferase [Patescibacteria group bacterium]
MKIDILGVTIDNLDKKQVLEKLEIFLHLPEQHQIVTVNPEFIVAAQKDEKFKNLLNKCALSIPDGFGLILAFKFLKRPLPERIPGVDLIWDIATLCEQNNCSIYLLGGKDRAAEKTAEILKNKCPNLKIIGDSEIIVENQELEIKNLELEKINNFGPDVLLVALGQVKQEKWIDKNLAKLPSVKFAMGVGGSFDFISGQIKRAPKFLRIIGLEWLWRLILEPWRWKRIYNAVIKFSWLVLTKR